MGFGKSVTLSGQNHGPSNGEGLRSCGQGPSVEPSVSHNEVTFIVMTHGVAKGERVSGSPF